MESSFPCPRAQTPSRTCPPVVKWHVAQREARITRSLTLYPWLDESLRFCFCCSQVEARKNDTHSRPWTLYMWKNIGIKSDVFCYIPLLHLHLHLHLHCGARFCQHTQLPILLFSPHLPLFSFFATCAITTPHLCGHVKVNELRISGNGFNSHAEKIHEHAWMPLAELSRNYKTKFRNFEVDK